MKGLKWINTGAFLLMILVVALALLLPIGGTTGEIALRYPNLFTPAPITFWILGVIALLLIGFIIYQLELTDEGFMSPQVREDIGIWFAISCLLSIAWTLTWHFGLIEASTVLIFAQLVSVIVTYRRAGMVEGGFFNRFLAKAGFSVWMGFLTVMSMVNMSALLTKLGWNGFGISPDIWTIALLIFGTVLAVMMANRECGKPAAAAIAWMYIGILIRHISQSGYAGSHPYIIAAALICVTVTVCAIFSRQLRWLQNKFSARERVCGM